MCNTTYIIYDSIFVISSWYSLLQFWPFLFVTTCQSFVINVLIYIYILDQLHLRYILYMAVNCVRNLWFSRSYLTEIYKYTVLLSLQKQALRPEAIPEKSKAHRGRSFLSLYMRIHMCNFVFIFGIDIYGYTVLLF